MIDDGYRFLRLLETNDFDVTAACWIRNSESGFWHLHIVTEVIDAKGPLLSYGEANRLLRMLPDPTITSSQIKLLGPTKPLAEKILDWEKRCPGRLTSLPNLTEFGMEDIDEIYPYPSLKLEQDWGRLAVHVIYSRRGATDDWTSHSEIGGLHEGLKPKGVVSYIAGPSRDAEEASEAREAVLILVELDFQLVRTNALDNPTIRKLLTDQARAMADDSFRSRHPGARILHEGDLAPTPEPASAAIAAG